MGSPSSEKNRTRKENQIDVTLTKGFWLARTEVTQSQWEKVMDTTPWRSEKGFGRARLTNGKLVLEGPVTKLAPGVKEAADCPATVLSWDDAVDFCRRLTEQERAANRLPAAQEYTLPTEAQWEYACRAGTTTSYSFGDNPSRLGDFAWWGGHGGHGNAQDEQYAHPVGTKLPNPWGFHDMHGNVQEWCRDWDAPLAGGVDPIGPVDGSYRVSRGGSWGHDAGFNRSATRWGLSPSHRTSEVGFRVAIVRSANPE